MREIRQSGSEGGAGYIPVPTPINGRARPRLGVASLRPRRDPRSRQNVREL